MYEVIVKYVTQGLQCVKKGINQICVKFHFPKIIKGVSFPENEQVPHQSILAPTVAQVPKYIGKATTDTFYVISQHKM